MNILEKTPENPIDHPKNEFTTFSDFSVIIPARNEAQNLKELFLISSRYKDKFLVILSKDTNDESESICKEFSVPFFRDNGGGKGCAIRQSLEIASCKVVVFFDADHSHEIMDIEKIVEPFSKPETKFVLASRILGGSEELSGSFDNWLRYFGNRLSSLLVSLIWGGNPFLVSDCQNGFRALNREFALSLDLREDTFSIEQEMVMKTLARNEKIDEIPSYEKKRRHGHSHILYTELFAFLRCFWRNL